MIDLTATDRPTFQTTVAPAALPDRVPSPDGTTLITEQQVLFSTAAALQPAKVGHWATAMKTVTDTMSVLFTESRPPAQRYVARRYAYLENAVMGREMYRL
ncbi:hypothetical protein MycrhN_5080 [Mycolicibacterium rhodesiae NBB3]|uniref:Uncharacterized protein n=1 Tax=Mycolicibacterium rhodesiae (strain NBB3) TaxID=710685 RepID=G8RVX5_MYCRN|nr:hypothetical protein [Mycolicibacterium rhodesiae]AEV75558.1 hypothetical protein MycrhN_5080 [Mycolicibacterium rhodesiae NBB3]